VVNFDGSASTPPLPGDSLTYAWDLDGDGQFDDATDLKPSVVYETTGARAVRLQVTDQRGVAVASDPVNVVVSDMPMTSTPPVPVIETPSSGLRWKVGDVISFTGKATDAEDGALAAAALSWLLVMEHCPAGCHSHVVQSWNGVAGASFTAPDHEFPSHIELVLIATDASGIRRSTSVRLDPQTVFVTLQSQPPGLELALGVDGQPAPFGREMIFGGNTTLGASPLQAVGPQTYAFVSWSNGQAATHDLGPLVTSQNLVATYRPAGLTGEYFADLALTQPRLVRIDPEVNFDWARDAPDPSVPDTFSTRWTGFVVPPTSDLYSFYTDSDDGIRVWVNGVLIIDAWNNHSLQRDRGYIPLLGGTKATIRIEYFDDIIDAVAKLYWSSLAAPAVTIVPTSRLYPACVAGACPNGLSCVAGECVSPCVTACPAGQRCAGLAGGCVDACKDVNCGRGKCAAGACLSRCDGVTCAAGLTCTPETGLCEDLPCKAVTCATGKTCVGGICKPVCEVSGCMETTRCNTTSGACEAKCLGVTCQPGFECLAPTGLCADKCLTLACPGQACQQGECKPACVVNGCAATESCNATTGACEARCAMISCATGAACVPTTGQCEPCAAGSCPAGDGGVDGGTDGGGEEDAAADGPEADAPGPGDAASDGPELDVAGPGQDAATDGGASDTATDLPVAGIPRPRSGDGCGCDVAGAPRPAGGAPALVALLALGASGLTRRRRR
jgi:MYXO-CTERM domain-containing protein